MCRIEQPYSFSYKECPKKHPHLFKKVVIKLCHDVSATCLDRLRDATSRRFPEGESHDGRCWCAKRDPDNKFRWVRPEKSKNGTLQLIATDANLAATGQDFADLLCRVIGLPNPRRAIQAQPCDNAADRSVRPHTRRHSESHPRRYSGTSTRPMVGGRDTDHLGLPRRSDAYMDEGRRRGHSHSRRPSHDNGERMASPHVRSSSAVSNGSDDYNYRYNSADDTGSSRFGSPCVSSGYPSPVPGYRAVPEAPYDTLQVPRGSTNYNHHHGLDSGYNFQHNSGYNFQHNSYPDISDNHSGMPSSAQVSPMPTLRPAPNAHAPYVTQGFPSAPAYQLPHQYAGFHQPSAYPPSQVPPATSYNNHFQWQQPAYHQTYATPAASQGFMSGFPPASSRMRRPAHSLHTRVTSNPNVPIISVSNNDDDNNNNPRPGSPPRRSSSMRDSRRRTSMSYIKRPENISDSALPGSARNTQYVFHPQGARRFDTCWTPNHDDDDERPIGALEAPGVGARAGEEAADLTFERAPLPEGYVAPYAESVAESSV